ncbi:hypothetical protein Bca4012_073081 [Brassica carinata]|uniref:(rape) hypothetical protein n=1 Tax=Brassica napus TaxID=3708 RepID=A0A816L410_BRANA|nr:unnamed protein product [Brassica napus]
MRVFKQVLRVYQVSCTKNKNFFKFLVEKLLTLSGSLWSSENRTSARRCAKASILQLDDVTLLKRLVQNQGGFSDLKPEEYYD